MDFSILLSLCNPMSLLVIATTAILVSRLFRPARSKRKRRRFNTAALGTAFQFLSQAYRPNHAFLAKAQIQQQEDQDDDANGDPESQLRHFRRQLRRIRRGEPVDSLIWRLE
jgi:hypothetical protein